MESSKDVQITIRLDQSGKIFVDIPEEGVDISLPDVLFLLKIAETQVVASYYASIGEKLPTN